MSDDDDDDGTLETVPENLVEVISRCNSIVRTKKRVGSKEENSLLEKSKNS